MAAEPPRVLDPSDLGAFTHEKKNVSLSQNVLDWENELTQLVVVFNN
jgi:hypothetical protein